MKPNFFVEITARSSVTTGGGRSTAASMAHLLQVVHGARMSRGIHFAVALPCMRQGENPYPGNMMRVFASQESDLALLLYDINANELLNGRVNAGKLHVVPADFAGPWVEYRRFRIPGRKSRTQETRARRMQIGDERPYLRLASKSTRSVHSVRIEEVRHASNPVDGKDFVPDCYGLSVSTRRFALPAM